MAQISNHSHTSPTYICVIGKSENETKCQRKADLNFSEICAKSEVGLI